MKEHSTLQPRSPTQAHRPGMALLIVLVAIVFLALAAYGFTAHMQSEFKTSRAHMERAQAKQAALSGLQWSLALLDAKNAPTTNAQRKPVEYLQSLEESANERSIEKQQAGWQFAVISPLAPSSSEDATSDRRQSSSGFQLESSSAKSKGTSRVPISNHHWRFGMENESAKIHLPTLLAWELASPGHARAVLSKLPNATPASVESMVLAIGIPNAPASNERRSRSSRRSRATPPVGIDPARNPLLQEGNQQVALLWNGGDWNQNFQLDAWEQLLIERQTKNMPSLLQGRSSQTASPNLENDPIPAEGWNRFFTWHSGCRNVNRSGQPRIPINQPNLASLHAQLLTQWPTEWANFVIAYRQYGDGKLVRSSPSRSAAATPTLTSAAGWTPDFAIPPAFEIKSLYDLFDIYVETTAVAGPRFRISSPFSVANSRKSDYLEKYLDAVTINPSPVLQGAIDILEAPPEVLLAIPGMQPTTVQQILAKRASLKRGPLPSTCGWLLSQGIANLETMRALDPWITCRNDMYQAQVIGFRDAKTPLHRCRVTLDATVTPARVIRYQDANGWDEGFDVEGFANQDFVPID